MAQKTTRQRAAESTPLLARMEDDQREYGALDKGRFKEHDGVIGEWHFQEEQRQLEAADVEEGREPESVVEHQNETFLEAWSRFLFSKRGLGLVLIMAITLALGVLALVYREELFHAFDTAAGFIRDQGAAGALILILAVAVTSFPPMIGYSWCLLACGYIYGWTGFIPGYIGALLGGISSFLLFRYAFRDWVETQTRNYPKYVALERAIEKEGLPLVILIRIAPYPYPIFNALFAATRVPFHVYAIGTAVALIKILIHISIGKSLSNFSDVIHGDVGSKWDLVYLIVGVTVGIGVCVYLYFRTKQHLQQYAEELDGETPYSATPVEEEEQEPEDTAQPRGGEVEMVELEKGQRREEEEQETTTTLRLTETEEGEEKGATPAQKT